MFLLWDWSIIALYLWELVCTHACVYVHIGFHVMVKFVPMGAIKGGWRWSSEQGFLPVGLFE